MRELLAQFKDCLKAVREKEGAEVTKNYDMEVVYAVGREALRATTTSWKNDFAAAFYQQGQFKWGSDEFLKQAFGDKWATDLASVRAQDL